MILSTFIFIINSFFVIKKMNCVKCNYPIKYGAILEVKNKGMKDEKFEYTCMECHSAEQFGFRGDQRIE